MSEQTVLRVECKCRCRADALLVRTSETRKANAIYRAVFRWKMRHHGHRWIVQYTRTIWPR